ncbi:killer suppression protein HigA [Candidatus Kaiserbacteria bacterium]|nr:killer suppression protein HigA [Candidatus Kaiserbacteria bacterium]
MEITFASRKIEKLCNSAKEMRAKLGDRNARLLQQRLSEIKAADTLDDLGKLPGARCHELKGGRHSQLAVDLVHPKRLVFEADHNPKPTKPDGGLDWQRVTRVQVLEIVDYH